MTVRDGLQLLLFVLLLIGLTIPLGRYLEDVFFPIEESSRPSTLLFRLLSSVIKPIENLFFKIAGINPEEDQHWTRYTLCLLVFSTTTFIVTYLILRFQHLLPLNPAHFQHVAPDLAFNTAMSFATNTDWQSYSGETTLSYFSQMVGLTFQNFISASVGIAAAIALIRGIALQEEKSIGNFWKDMLRGNLYVLLPFCILFAFFLMSQGVIQNLLPYQEVTTLEGAKQVIAQGPVASQVAIKTLGSNGGGFFNANSAHPYENPTPLTNFIQMLSIFLIPSGFILLLGRRIQNIRHAWAIWITAGLLFLGGVIICSYAEYQGNPIFTHLGCATPANFEGKETRFGIFNSAFFSTVTTAASCGAVNSMLDSFTPLGGLVPLVNILLGEIVFGGVGSGLYGMLMFVILTVFIAGLMVGRTPEYIGKKIEAKEVQYVMAALIVMALSILGFTAIASVTPSALSSLGNPGSHGFTEMLYAYASATGNNGSAFAGLSTNTPYWNYTLAAAMFLGRYFMMIPMLAVAGSLVKKKAHPVGDGTFAVDSPLFIILLLGIILLVGALIFVPALCLGPINEALTLNSNTSKQ